MSARRVSGLVSIASMCFALCVAGWSRSANQAPLGGQGANPGGTLDADTDQAQPRVRRPFLTLAESFAGLRPPADTLLVDSIRAGQVLIRRLPDHLHGRPVETYEPVIVPTTGWLRDRSFFWRVPPDLAGAFQFVFAAVHRGAAPDTVVVQVQVSP